MSSSYSIVFMGLSVTVYSTVVVDYINSKKTIFIQVIIVNKLYSNDKFTSN